MRRVFIPLGPIAWIAVASACSGDGGSPPSAADAMPAPVPITVTDFAFEAPDTLQEGWTTFHLANEGRAIHAAMMAELEEGQSVEAFRAAYAAVRENDGPWESLGLRGGIVGPFPQVGFSNATLHLEPGHYVWYCPLFFDDGVPHLVGHGMAHPFVVVERDPSAPVTAEPEPTLTITMVDYAFGLSATPTAGRHVIRVENQGPEPHEVILMRLAPDRTLDDARSWLEGGFRGPPPFDRGLGGVTLERVGDEAYFEAELTPGDYVLYCVISAPDGRRHFEHGMILPLRIE